MLNTINEKSANKMFVHCSFHPLQDYQAGNFCWPKQWLQYLGMLFQTYLEDQSKCLTSNTDYFGQCEMMDQLYLSMRGKVNILKLNQIPKLVCYILTHYSQLLKKKLMGYVKSLHPCYSW